MLKQIRKKITSIDSRMVINGLLFVAGLTSIVTGIAGQPKDHLGYQGGRNFEGTRQEYRQEIREENRELRDIHKYSGYAFAGLMAVHLLQHYKPIENYLKRKKQTT